MKNIIDLLPDEYYVMDFTFYLGYSERSPHHSLRSFDIDSLKLENSKYFKKLREDENYYGTMELISEIFIIKNNQKILISTFDTTSYRHKDIWKDET